MKISIKKHICYNGQNIDEYEINHSFFLKGLIIKRFNDTNGIQMLKLIRSIIGFINNGFRLILLISQVIGAIIILKNIIIRKRKSPE
jgi:hypothetical protein